MVSKKAEVNVDDGVPLVSFSFTLTALPVQGEINS